MEFDLFGVYDPRPCTCGAGWCEPCGTWHRSTESEMLELDRRLDVTEQMHGTRGGVRVIRKKIGESS